MIVGKGEKSKVLCAFGEDVERKREREGENIAKIFSKMPKNVLVGNMGDLGYSFENLTLQLPTALQGPPLSSSGP